MHAIKEKYRSIFSVILPQIESLLSHNDSHYLLQLGNLSLNTFQLSMLPYHLCLAEEKNQYTKPHIYSHYDALPFYNESIDAILTPYLPHYETHAKTIIKELLRILKPDGYLFVLGISPVCDTTTFSLKATRSSFARLANAYRICWHIKQADGIIIERKSYFDNTTSSQNKAYKLLEKWLSKMPLLWPTEKHYYLITAQKKAAPLHVIPLSEPVIPFSNIKKDAYVKS